MSGTVRIDYQSPSMPIQTPATELAKPIVEAENEVHFIDPDEAMFVESNPALRDWEEIEPLVIESVTYENIYEIEPPKPTWWDRVKRFIQTIITRIKNAASY